jgi:hypothetical protein
VREKEWNIENFHEVGSEIVKVPECACRLHENRSYSRNASGDVLCH